ncbi:uncharacterized protein BXZ73DRAFT_57860 [Epithele typhae]|uniref:uncharacterized protein n=1 Tax=Epithele typhae TaxID=378194 RepID=UPI0020074849|nr:uncharacterized protein BXZ73DRAFT_57860 [Epithele typhae]KAH9910697.1 hypothetical protein BXZ73DRAFT_57860 [Epithele typhae]
MSQKCDLCNWDFSTQRGYNDHIRTVHSHPRPNPQHSRIRYHKQLNGLPCNPDGAFLPRGAPPPLRPNDIDWHPFPDRPSFEFAQWSFDSSPQSRAGLRQLWKILQAKFTADGLENYSPFYRSKSDIEDAIDDIPFGDAAWTTIAIRYRGPVGPDSPSWKRQVYLVHTRDALTVAECIAANAEFKDMFDYVPYEEYTAPDCRRVCNLMSGQWAFRMATHISEDPDTHGSMLVPIILGADKTTVSVATGNQEYHPVYMSLGNLHNTARRAHREGIVPLAFLPIPKAAREWEDDEEFRIFKKTLYHAALAAALEPLRHGMTTPQVLRCPDGHFRRAIFQLGPFIADYPEQVYLSGVVSGWCPKCDAVPAAEFLPGAPRSHHTTDEMHRGYTENDLWDLFGVNPDVTPFTTYFPRADIHELLTPDILHQLIKGTFKDHVVEWVLTYINQTNQPREAKRIIDEIDRRISAASPFQGLRRFPQGRNFKQWTGDDSKALMKVFLPAIVGFVPDEMVQCVAALLDFCYLARRPSHDTHSLTAMEGLLQDYHRLRTVFIAHGIRPDGFALPRQHALVHYVRSIQLFGSPNGLCSSITESKHIHAVKQPWRESNRRNPLPQILRKLTRRSKLAAARTEFGRRGMLHGDVLAAALHDAEQEGAHLDEDACSYLLAFSKPANIIANRLAEPDLVELLRRFLYSQAFPDAVDDPSTVDIRLCPLVQHKETIKVYYSATAVFYAPSDLASGPGGMSSDIIRCTPLWWGEYPRYDTVLVSVDDNALGTDGMLVARVRAFLSFRHGGRQHECALVHWFERGDDEPDPVTGMWIYRPEKAPDGNHVTSVIPIGSIVRACHLIGVYTDGDKLPDTYHYSDSLDHFNRFYLNWYIDYHAHETIC